MSKRVWFIGDRVFLDSGQAVACCGDSVTAQGPFRTVEEAKRRATYVTGEVGTELIEVLIYEATAIESVNVAINRTVTARQIETRD